MYNGGSLEIRQTLWKIPMCSAVGITSPQYHAVQSFGRGSVVSRCCLCRSTPMQIMANCVLQVIDSMEEKRYQPGDAVINEGGPGDFFYVTGSGELEVRQYRRVHCEDNIFLVVRYMKPKHDCGDCEAGKCYHGHMGRRHVIECLLLLSLCSSKNPIWPWLGSATPS